MGLAPASPLLCDSSNLRLRCRSVVVSAISGSGRFLAEAWPQLVQAMAVLLDAACLYLRDFGRVALYRENGCCSQVCCTAPALEEQSFVHPCARGQQRGK